MVKTYILHVEWFTNFSPILIYPSFVKHLTEVGHKNDQNMEEENYVYTYVLLLVSIPYLIAQSTVMDYLELKKKTFQKRFFQAELFWPHEKSSGKNYRSSLQLNILTSIGMSIKFNNS
jgi:hypothetical protein